MTITRKPRKQQLTENKFHVVQKIEEVKDYFFKEMIGASRPKRDSSLI